MKVLTQHLMRVLENLPDPKTYPGDFYKVIVPEDLVLQNGMSLISPEDREKADNAKANILTFRKTVFSTKSGYSFTRWVLEVGEAQ